MKITADTNVLVRALIRDDPRQAQAAARLLMEAELIAVSLPCLCEFVWVLSRTYRFSNADVSAALHTLLDARNIAVDRSAVEAGFATLHGGGDFADGVIAYEGRWLGGETFVSFDKKAVSLVAKQGQPAKLLT